MNSHSRVVGILVDAENLSSWEEGTLGRLLSRAGQEGAVNYRRAYADWAACPKHAPELSRLGFDLVQVYHPAARKNSADIHMTVDAMDLLAFDTELRTFVLVTGDSDFAPLFRRLRERGCRVIGAGPRSTLSAAVVSSCVDYLYVGATPQKTRAFTFGRTRPNIRRPMPPKEPAARPPAPAGTPPSAANTPATPNNPSSTASAWRRHLRTWGWSRITGPEFRDVVEVMNARGSATRSEFLEHVAGVLGAACPARKVYSLLFKANLLERDTDADGQVSVRRCEDGLEDRVDVALFRRIHRVMLETGLEWDEVLLEWLVGPGDPERLARLAAESERETAA